MLTPINEILEELIGDIAEASGERWEYLFREKMLGPEHGLYIDITDGYITIHGRLDTEEVIFSDSYVRKDPDGPTNYDIFLSGLIYFYRLIGMHLGVEDNLAKFSVTMTEQVVKELTASANDGKAVTLSFKDNKAWIDINNLI